VRSKLCGRTTCEEGVSIGRPGAGRCSCPLSVHVPIEMLHVPRELLAVADVLASDALAHAGARPRHPLGLGGQRRGHRHVAIQIPRDVFA